MSNHLVKDKNEKKPDRFKQFWDYMWEYPKGSTRVPRWYLYLFFTVVPITIILTLFGYL